MNFKMHIIVWTHNVAVSQWKKENQVSYTIYNVHKTGNKSTAQEELCNLQGFLFPITTWVGPVKLFLRKVLNQFYVTGN